MKNRRWRIAAILSSMALVVPALLVNAGAVTAAGSGSLTWTGSYWKDANCGLSTQQFEVRLFRHTNYAGTQWRLCTSFPDFCSSPYGYDSSAGLLCRNGFDGDTMNDYPSSFKVVSVGGGASCRVRIHEHINYGGAAVTYWDPVNVSSLVPWPNDALSSIRRLC